MVHYKWCVSYISVHGALLFDQSQSVKTDDDDQQYVADNIGYQLADVNGVPGAVTTGADVGDLLCGVLQEQS